MTLTHLALFYRGLDEFLDGVGGFIQDGLKADEPVYVAVPPERLGALRDYLAPDTERVCFANMAEIGRNPGRILTALTDFADRRGAGRAWLVGEPIWASRSAPEVREATRHEALINLAFAGEPVTILCPYDIDGLPAAALADAERTHPALQAGGNQWASPAYADPRTVCADCDAPEIAPDSAERIPFGPDDLTALRRRAHDFGLLAGVNPVRGVDLTLAVAEAATNAIRHGGGGGTLAMWRGSNEVIIEMRDSGRLTDPLAGRRRPPLTAAGGRGLWLIHQLCDLVEFGPGLLRLRFAA